MTVSLGGLALSDNLYLDIGPTGVSSSQRWLIGGASVVQADGNIGGRTLILEGINCWTMAQVEQIRVMESQGLAVDLIHHRGNFQVFITDTSDLKPTRKYKNPVSTDWYTGTVTMIEVS